MIQFPSDRRTFSTTPSGRSANRLDNKWTYTHSPIKNTFVTTAIFGRCLFSRTRGYRSPEISREIRTATQSLLRPFRSVDRRLQRRKRLDTSDLRCQHRSVSISQPITFLRFNLSFFSLHHPFCRSQPTS